MVEAYSSLQVTSAFSVQRKNWSKSFRVKIRNYKLAKMNSPANGSSPLTCRGLPSPSCSKTSGARPNSIQESHSPGGTHSLPLGDRRHRPPRGGRKPAHALGHLASWALTVPTHSFYPEHKFLPPSPKSLGELPSSPGVSSEGHRLLQGLES